MEYFVDGKQDSTIWSQKYCPKNMDDIIGNSNSVEQIISWLIKFDEIKRMKKGAGPIKIDDVVKVVKTIELTEDDTEKEIDQENDVFKNTKTKKNNFSCLVVSGDHGVGKTCIVGAILNEGYKKQVLNMAKIKKKEDIVDVIKSLMNTSGDILSSMKSKKSKNVLIVDEVETITTKNEKACLSMILKINSIHWICPIIFISAGKHSRLLTEIKKHSHEVKIFHPTFTDMVEIIKKISKTEKINIGTVNNSKLLTEITSHAQNDFSRLIMILHDLKDTFGKKKITQETFEEYLKISKKKDEDFDLFKATNEILNKYEDIEKCMIKYRTDKVILPLMMMENYLRNMENRKNISVETFEIASKISGFLAEGDIIENYIYGEQNWEMHEVHGMYTCVFPSYLLNKGGNNNKNPYIMYPMDLNKASISKINKKNIINAGKVFEDKNINDYININIIIRHLIETDRLDECAKILKEYNVDIGTIEALLKIDKIKPNKVPLTTKQKREINGILGK
jgi:replication factor C subunit 1